MKNIIKNLSVGSYIVLASAVFALAGMVLSLISCSPSGFMIVQMPLIIVLSLLAAVFIVFAAAFSAIKKDNFIITIVLTAASVLLMIVLFNLIDGKYDVLGTVLFSDLEKGYAPAETACYWGVASMVVYIVSIILAIVGGFFKAGKN